MSDAPEQRWASESRSSKSALGDPKSPALEFTRGVRIDPSALQFSFSRSSGPGGQAVNKLNTKAELRVPVERIENLTDEDRQRLERLAGRYLTTSGELLITAQSHRSQHANRRACVERLRQLILEALQRPRKRLRTKPGKAARERRLQTKQRVSEKKRLRRPPDQG